MEKKVIEVIENKKNKKLIININSNWISESLWIKTQTEDKMIKPSHGWLGLINKTTFQK